MERATNLTDCSTVGSFLQGLGRRVREARRALNLSQDVLAEAAGLTAKYISEIENGRTNPSVDVLRAIAEKGLKIPLAALFNFDVSADEGRAIVAEVASLLAGQPRGERQRALRVLRAMFGSD